MIVEKGYVSLVDVFEETRGKFIDKVSLDIFELFKDKLGDEVVTMKVANFEDGVEVGIPHRQFDENLHIPNWVYEESEKRLDFEVYYSLAKFKLNVFHKGATSRVSWRIMDSIRDAIIDDVFSIFLDSKEIDIFMKFYRDYLMIPHFFRLEDEKMLYVDCNDWSINLAGYRFFSGFFPYIYDPLKGYAETNIKDCGKLEFEEELIGAINGFEYADIWHSPAHVNNFAADIAESKFPISSFGKPSPLERFEGGFLCIEESDQAMVEQEIEQKIQNGVFNLNREQYLPEKYSTKSRKKGRPATPARELYYQHFPDGKPEGMTWKAVCAFLQNVGGVLTTERSLQNYENERI